MKLKFAVYQKMLYSRVIEYVVGLCPESNGLPNVLIEVNKEERFIFYVVMLYKYEYDEPSYIGLQLI